MNTTDLITTTRESAAIGDASAYIDFTDARVLRELNDKLCTVFEDLVTKSRSGYWLHETVFTTTPGKSRYRIPARAVVGGLESVMVATTVGGPFYELDEIPPTLATEYEGQPGTTGQPVVFTVIGDQVEFVPAPATQISVKFTYYIRPSRLVAQQSSAIGGTVRGQVTLVNTGTRQITVNALPFDQSLAVPAAITSAVQRIDIVHPDGWHELSLVGATQTIAGLVFTVGGTDPLTDVEIGDFVRVADQTDWPALPDDFHRCLCDATAVKILIEIHLTEKSEVLAANNGNDLVRFKSLLYPRVKTQPKQVGIMRRSRGGSWPTGRFYG